MSKAIQLTQTMLNSVASVKDVVELPAVQDNWIKTYEKTTGRQDGAMRYEGEKVLFMQTIGQNKKLNDCNKFTLYAAWIELSISGLTLRDGITYIIPYGDKASFMVGWKGRLEQINEKPDIVFTHEPQVVYDCDIFVYSKGESVRIKEHTPEGKAPRTKESKITHVYFVIDFTHGPKVYVMDAIDVLNIRDQYSESYKSYARALSQPVNQGKKWGDKLTVKYKKNGEWKEFESDDVPMWVSDEAQAFKKTIVKRVYGSLPKLPKQKYLDEQMAARAKELSLDGTRIDADELSKFVNAPDELTGQLHGQQEDENFASYTEVLNEDGGVDTVDTESGEVKKTEPAKEKTTAKKATPKVEPKAATLSKEAESEQSDMNMTIEQDQKFAEGEAIPGLDAEDLEGDSF